MGGPSVKQIMLKLIGRGIKWESALMHMVFFRAGVDVVCENRAMQ